VYLAKLKDVGRASARLLAPVVDLQVISTPEQLQMLNVGRRGGEAGSRMATHR
jgi:hypothetical protein